MAHEHRLGWVCSDIQHYDRVNVDENGLIPNNHLSTVVSPIVNEHLNIPNIELILELDYKLAFINVLFIEFKDVEPKLSALSVAKNVEFPGLALELDVLDQPDAVHVIYVHLFLGFSVHIETIICGGNHKHVLLIIHVEIDWLSLQRISELVDRLDITHCYIKDEYL